jgi:hypothetical protein
MCKPENPSPSGCYGRPLRVVIADSDPEMLRFYSRAYRRLGHEVVGVAQSVWHYIELRRTLCPDLILCHFPQPPVRRSSGLRPAAGPAVRPRREREEKSLPSPTGSGQ